MNVLSRHTQRKEAQRRLGSLFERPDRLRIIHYSCESFRDREELSSPRITSIAVKHQASGQTISFSIHQVAERSGLLDRITEAYDELERTMLDEFVSYYDLQPPGTKWLSWNMRDTNYGFLAISHRHRVLGGSGRVPTEDNIVDLAVLMKGLHGYEYVPHPRLPNLVRLNSLSQQHFLTGQEEADAFTAGRYVPLHQSTLKKVDVISEIAELAVRGVLKTRAKARDVYGWTVSGLYERVIESRWWKVTTLALAGVGLASGIRMLAEAF